MPLVDAIQIIIDLIETLEELTPEQNEAVKVLIDFAVNQLGDD